MNSVPKCLTRRAAFVALGMLAFAPCFGCAAGPVLARVPWRTLLGLVIVLMRDRTAIANMFGEDHEGKNQEFKVNLTKEQLEGIKQKGFATVELQDGTRKTISPNYASE